METTLLTTLFKLTITGSVLVFAVLLLRFAFKSRLPKAFTVWLWIVAFIAFLVPVTIPAPPFISAIYSNIGQIAAQPQSTQSATQLNQQNNSVSQSSQAKSSTVKKTVQHKKPTATVTVSKPFNPYHAGLIIWGSVSAALITSLLALYALTLRRFKALKPVPDNEDFEALRSAVKIRHCIPLGLSPNTAVPVTAGIFRTKIVMPHDFDLSDSQTTSHIYVHELIHIKRRDNAVSLIALFIACLHWFNPLVWIAYRSFCRDLELSCDSRAVKILGYQRRSEYADSLLSIAGSKKKLQPMFMTAFGKYDIKERVTNIMNTRRISARIISLCIVCVLITGIAFAAVSCTKSDKTASGSSSSQSGAKASSSSSSSKSAAEKDITTTENKSKFSNDYVMAYYCNVMDDNGKRLNFDGKITSKKMGDGIFLCSINNNKSDVDINNYKKGDQYIIPEDAGDKIIKSRFDLKTIDHSMISYYDANKKAYVFDSGLLGEGCYVWPEVRKITQTDDIVVVTVDFYQPKEGNDEPDLTKKIQSMKYTLKQSNDNYLFVKVENL